MVQTFRARREALEREDAAGWGRADLAMALIALQPWRLKGAVLEGAAPEIGGLLQDRLMDRLSGARSCHRLPISITDDRLMGGLDLAATLATGTPVTQPGLIARAHGGVLTIPMAERLPGRVAALVAQALDTGEAATERDGVSSRTQAQFVALALSDPDEPGEELPSGLGDRLAFRLAMHNVSPARQRKDLLTPEAIEAARAKLGSVVVTDDQIQALVQSAMGLGIVSFRAPAFCLAAARGIAALAGRGSVTDPDLKLSAELIYAGRARRFPPPPEPAAPEPEQPDGRDENSSRALDQLTEMLVEAVQVRVSLDLAARDQARRPAPKREPATGKSGDQFESSLRGNRMGTRPGDPRRRGRLDLLATFTAAAPWQSLRSAHSTGAAIVVRPEDLRIRRFKRRSESVIIFAVDASGSAAMHRLAEAKGAIELLLSGCYTRRESVALIAFRKESADLLLPPTRSLTRVKRALSRLPGGGGTPLAAGISAAAQLAQIERNRRKSPYIVFLSDGQGNVALDGSGGRERAAEDARDMARRLRMLSEPVLFFDISRRPSPEAREICSEMGAVYQPLPVADAQRLSQSVRILLN